MDKLYKILLNKYLLYIILFLIIFAKYDDLNVNIIKYASVVTLICYFLISQYNISMEKKDVQDNDISNFFITGESYKTEYIVVTCIYLSAIYAIIKTILL